MNTFLIQNKTIWN